MLVAALITSTPRRAASGLTSAGRIASPAIDTERSGALIGLSSRSHAVAIAAAGMSAVPSVLRNARLPPSERGREVAAGAHDCDGDADRLQPEQLGLRPSRQVHEDERGAAPRERALHEPVDQRDIEARRDDDELERARRDAAVRLQERERRRARVRLRSRERLTRSPPLPFGGHRLRLARSGIDDQRAPATTAEMRLQDRACGAHSDLEALTRTGAGIAVEQDRDLVARRILELLHHQAAPARGRAPVHHAERLALRVLADAVQLVPGRAPQQQPPPVLRVRAALREEALQLDEPRIDDERLRLALLERRTREPERVLDREAYRVERVAASRNGAQVVAAGESVPADAAQLDAQLGEAPGPLMGDERRRRDRARRRQLEVDMDVVALDDVARRAVPADDRRPGRQADPADADRDCEQEPGRRGIERTRAEHPGREVDDEAEGENRAAALRHTGTGVLSSAS